MKLPYTIGEDLGKGGFRYYAFMSFPGTDSTTENLAEVFRDRLDQELRSHLPKIVAPDRSTESSFVFFAPTNIRTGNKWRETLHNALVGSVGMVALCAPMYSHPDHSWCGRELAGMLNLGKERGLRADLTPVFAVELGLSAIADDLRSVVQTFDLSGRPVRGLANTRAFDKCVADAAVHILDLLQDLCARNHFAAGSANFRIPEKSWFRATSAPGLPNRADLLQPEKPENDPFVRSHDKSTVAGTEAIDNRVISFYSYKGGVGRTMAIANIGTVLAESLANAKERVLLIDWDLEAPGLHDWFSDARLDSRPGILDYFFELQNRLVQEPKLYARILANPDLLNEVAPIQNFVSAAVPGNLDLITAGVLDGSYRRRASEFDWDGFWTRWPGVFRCFRTMVEKRWRHTLIDCRTGFSDVSGLSSAVLASRLVLVFVPNNQNLKGSIEVARRAVFFRRRTDDIRPLSIYPLPSRVNLDQERERDRWRLRYETEFENCFRELYHEPRCSLSRYFSEIEVPNVPSFAFGEQLVVLAQEEKSAQLRQAYERFAETLVTTRFAWQESSEDTFAQAVR